jgi:hypothetical protein
MNRLYQSVKITRNPIDGYGEAVVTGLDGTNYLACFTYDRGTVEPYVEGFSEDVLAQLSHTIWSTLMVAQLEL